MGTLFFDVWRSLWYDLYPARSVVLYIRVCLLRSVVLW